MKRITLCAEIAAVVASILFPMPASAEANEGCRPETLFHIIGGNASKAGLTTDLEALKDAGFGGILFFHGQYGASSAWDGVEEQIPCLSAKWDDLVRHIGTECKRLGLTFKMQNCPGWSMSGGPWITHTNAMRKIVYARGRAGRPRPAEATLRVPAIPIPRVYADADSDWRDVCYLAFPTPEGEMAARGDDRPPDARPPMIETNGNVRVFRYVEPVIVRTLELPSPRLMAGAYCYNPDIRITLEAKSPKGWQNILDVECPQGNWQDYGRDALPLSFACEEASSKEWRLTLSSPHEIKLPFARLRSAARLDNWEALAAHTLRGQLKRPQPKQSAAAYIPRAAVHIVKPGDVLPERERGWTVLRVGHVNMKKRNVAAPKESTGWECDKLDPRGIEAHFAGFIGRLASGPLAGGLLDGMETDSWECARQTWTWRMPEYWRKATGRDVREIIPALFGYVIGSPEETWSILHDWRALISKLITENYYRRMAELAHGKGLSATYETAFGDVIPGDILEYWKWCDTPMCEFWHPVAPGREETTFPNFKPVKPCVSAAHLYGKRRVSAEAFTSMTLSWDENFRDLKAAAVRHFARGVTHLAFHTFTHTPQMDGRVPGTSFGASIGTPFVRGQTWWSFVRSFTDWAAECCAFLERGHPGVDVLRYLGDEFDHKPDELEYFPEGFKCDYLNADVLFNRLDVKDGRFVLPDGMSYAVLWVPPSVLVLPKTQSRLDALAAKGGRIVRGTADDAVRGLTPQIVNAKGLLWYRRIDGDRDCFFVAAEEGGFTGEATFNTMHGERRRALRLAPFETRFLEFAPGHAGRVTGLPDSQLGHAGRVTLPCPRNSVGSSVPLDRNNSYLISNWQLSFPAGWGAPERLSLERLMPWKDLPGVSEEGRAFSGTATYTTTLNLQDEPERPIMLDLGDVRDFARVFVNGREVAALWAQPYRCDIAPFARKGVNDLRVEVTSTWFNRLAYDFGQPPEKRKTWTIWDIPRFPPPCLTPNATLCESGLLGPVKIYSQDACSSPTATNAVTTGVRPYEMVWAGRDKDDRPVLLPLTSADGWTCVASNTEASVSTGRKRILFGDGVMHLEYRLDAKGGSVHIAPPKPVPTPPGFDTVSVWLYGNHTCFYRNAQARPILSAEFKDAEGRPFSVDLHVFNHGEWFLAQKRLPEGVSARVAKGGAFTGFTLRGEHDDKRRWIELTSFAAFKEELAPLSFRPRPKRGVQTFPNAPQGLNTGEGRLSFPNVDTTIIPIVAEDPEIEFKLPQNPTNWDDLAVRWRGHTGRVPLPASNSTVGSRVPRDRNATETGSEDGWFYFAKGGGLFPAAAAKGAKVRFRRIANSLVAEIEAPAGVEEVRFGRPERVEGMNFVPLPYYTCGGNGEGAHRRPCVVMAGEGGGRIFFLASADWTQSNASWMFAPNWPPSRPPVASNGGVRYYPKTDGKRNPVFERFVWSFSRTFEDVMPVIPNPPSPHRAATAGRQWAVMHAGDRERDKAMWRLRRRRGIRHLIVNDHETCMRDGNESFTFRTHPAPRKGGDEGMRDFTRFMIDGLGYMYGPYNNYTDFAPVNGWWSADRVARARDGNLQRAWNRCYAPKPAFINEACEEIWAELQCKFAFNTAYCDVHTCPAPWQRTDYDARVPGAGTFAATFYAYGELLDFERRTVGGPVYSEGQNHYMYCGLVDGNYAQDGLGHLDESPWLVDFDLRRIHPLCNNFGMGNPSMFYSSKRPPKSRVERRDRFLAATVAFGHQGFFMLDEKGADRESEEHGYFMLLGTARHYCMEDAKSIRYADAAGNLRDTSDAVASGAYRRSQVVVHYSGGTMTAANGSTNETMAVDAAGGRIALAPNGYFALAGDASACVVSGAERMGGGRLDVSVAPDYVYLKAYGKLVDSPFGGTDGRMYRLIEEGGTDEVFLCEGRRFALPYAAASAVALDETGREMGRAQFSVERGRTLLAPMKGAFSYRVRKPADWREPEASRAAHFTLARPALF